MNQDKRAWLIDSHAHIFRAFHLWPQAMTDDRGHPVNALHGFADFLLELLESLQRSDDGELTVICAFDAPCNRGFRQAIYPGYKAHRPPPPPLLVEQFSRCRALAEAAGLPVLDHPGYEADDVIGTLARELRSGGHQLTILTGDKDLAQLLAPGDRWWNPGRNRILEHGDIERHFGVRPEQIPDWLALTGDASDNIPGVPGIGPRIAARLLRKHVDLDGIYGNLNAVYGMKFRGAPRAQKLLIEHEQTVRLARRLTGIVQDLPLTAGSRSWRPADPEALERLLREARIDASRRRRWQAACAQAQPA
ncbi:MAG: 5'-3' exonuclease [Halothiobacillaceae bacterium]